jgi:predicted nuclease of predicted toxin-antitoxin system
MKLKLDEKLGHTAADLFRQDGHDVETVSGEGLAGEPDTRVIEACRLEGRGLVTLDLDFSNPLVFNPADFAGIAVLRLPSEASPADLMLACRTLLGALRQGTLSGKLWSVERGRFREYRPADPELEGET